MNNTDTKELTGLHEEQLEVATLASAYEMDYKLCNRVIDHVSLHDHHIGAPE